MEALLFRLSPMNGPPTWKVCPEELIEFYTHRSRGWHVLGRESAVFAEPIDTRSEIEQVRDSDEKRFNAAPRLWKSRRRNGSTGE